MSYSQPVSSWKSNSLGESPCTVIRMGEGVSSDVRCRVRGECRWREQRGQSAVDELELSAGGAKMYHSSLPASNSIIAIFIETLL